MLLLIILLSLASVLQQSLGKEHDPSPVAELTEKQKKEIVDKHNAIRRDVEPTASNMLKMTWSEKASESAKKWAAKCDPSISPVEQRLVDGNYCGENSMQSGFLWTWKDAIDIWSQNRFNFIYGVGAIDKTEGADVYTQLIWHNSHSVGCALAYCIDEGVDFFFHVCHYCPAGNIMHQMGKPYKKGPPCEDCPNSCENKLCTIPCPYKNILRDCDELVNMFEKVNGKCSEKWLEEKCKASCSCQTETV